MELSGALALALALTDMLCLIAVIMLKVEKKHRRSYLLNLSRI